MGSEVDCSGVSRAVWLVKVTKLVILLEAVYIRYLTKRKMKIVVMKGNMAAARRLLAEIFFGTRSDSILPSIKVPKYLSNIWMTNTDASGIVGTLQITK